MYVVNAVDVTASKKRAKTVRCALVPPYGPLFLWTWQPSSKPHKVCDVVCRWMEIRPNAATGFVSLNERITFDVLHYDVLIDQRRPYATQPSHQVRGDTRHFDMLRRRMPSNTWHSLICGLSLSLSLPFSCSFVQASSDLRPHNWTHACTSHIYGSVHVLSNFLLFNVKLLLDLCQGIV